MPVGTVFKMSATVYGKEELWVKRNKSAEMSRQDGLVEPISPFHLTRVSQPSYCGSPRREEGVEKRLFAVTPASAGMTVKWEFSMNRHPQKREIEEHRIREILFLKCSCEGRGGDAG
jgi:hypothetical protein